MSTQKITGGYKIGKGKPPKDTQWKPGQSGNPKGRPKAAKSEPTDGAAITLLAGKPNRKMAKRRPPRRFRRNGRRGDSLRQQARA